MLCCVDTLQEGWHSWLRELHVGKGTWVETYQHVELQDCDYYQVCHLGGKDTSSWILVNRESPVFTINWPAPSINRIDPNKDCRQDRGSSQVKLGSSLPWIERISHSQNQIKWQANIQEKSEQLEKEEHQIQGLEQYRPGYSIISMATKNRCFITSPISRPQNQVFFKFCVKYFVWLRKVTLKKWHYCGLLYHFLQRIILILVWSEP